MCEGFSVRNGEIEVHLHWHIRQRPCGPLQMINLLKSELTIALRISKDKPVDIIREALGRGLVS